MNACKCKNRDAVVMVRNGNYSAFNGYRFTPSDYSLVRCRACDAQWRTKAKWVDNAPDDPSRAQTTSSLPNLQSWHQRVMAEPVPLYMLQDAEEKLAGRGTPEQREAFAELAWSHKLFSWDFDWVEHFEPYLQGLNPFEEDFDWDTYSNTDQT